MLTGAVSGGTGSVLGGGNFWMGAAQGVIVTTFNYLAHHIDQKIFEKKLTADIIAANYEIDGKPIISKEEVYEFIKKVKILNKLYGKEVQVSDTDFTKLPDNNNTYDNNLKIIKGYDNINGFEIVSNGTVWILKSSFASYYTLGYNLGVVKMASFFYWDLTSVKNRSERLENAIYQSLNYLKHLFFD